MELKNCTLSIHKTDAKHDIVFGTLLVSMVNGEKYVDLQDDHIPPDVMYDAAVNFADSAMPVYLQHEGYSVGRIIFIMPITDDIKSSYGLTHPNEFLMIAAKITDKAALKRVTDGEFKGFSLGGFVKRETHESN